MFAKLATVDFGFEDQSFRSQYGDHVADPESLDVETRLIAEYDSKHHFLECVHEEAPVIEVAEDWSAEDTAIVESIIEDIRVMARRPEIESGRRLARNGVEHDKVASITRGHDRRKMQRAGGNYARRATAAV